MDMFDGISFAEYMERYPEIYGETQYKQETDRIDFVMSRLDSYAKKVNKKRQLINSQKKMIDGPLDALIEYFRIQSKYVLMEEQIGVA